MTAPPPLVSVLMPAYNTAAYLAEAIESIQAQTLTHWELIIADDGSTDDTLAIARHYASQDPRIVVLHHPHNSGSFARMRNAAFAAANGDYIACLDSDDTYKPNALQALCQQLEAHPHAKMVYGAFGLADHNNHPLKRQPFGVSYRQNRWLCHYVVPHTWPNILLSRVPNQMQAMVFRRQFLQQLAHQQPHMIWAEDPELMYFADWHLTIKAYMQAGFNGIVALPQVVFTYRQVVSYSWIYNPGSNQKKLDTALHTLDWFYDHCQPADAVAQRSHIYATTVAMHACPAYRMKQHGSFWRMMGAMWQHPRITKADALLVTAKTTIRTYLQNQ
jgi:glycosyltransferase involved in cell wall biosynthesis